jgi:hypothetical protein
MWKDMDVAIQFQDEKTFFIGEHPTSPDDCLKRFALVMGASATNLAKSTRKKKGLTLSKRGPKGLKEGGAILQIFKGRICDGNGQNDINAEHVLKIFEGSNWDFELNEEGRIGEVYRDSNETPRKTPVKHLHVAKLLGLVLNVVQAETVEIAFDVSSRPGSVEVILSRYMAFQHTQRLFWNLANCFCVHYTIFEIASMRLKLSGPRGDGKPTIISPHQNKVKIFVSTADGVVGCFPASIDVICDTVRS